MKKDGSFEQLSEISEQFSDAWKPMASAFESFADMGARAAAELKLVADMGARVAAELKPAMERFQLAEAIAAIPVSPDDTFPLLTEKIATALKDNNRETISAADMTMILVALYGAAESPDSPLAKSIISAAQSDRAGRNRNRPAAAWAAPALVAQVRQSSRKKQWNAAWKWLCEQADCRAELQGDFTLIEVAENVVRYSHGGEPKPVRVISETHFRDTWNRQKKAGT